MINEVLYDPSASGDAGEFIELKNQSTTPVALTSCSLVLVDGATGTAYSAIALPAGATIPASGYYVIGAAATLGAADYDFPLANVLQNGSPDSIILKGPGSVVLDAVTYEADAAYGSGSEAPGARSEGGTGAVASTSIGSADNASLGRLPDGVDTNSNLQDFSPMPPTPGSANVSAFTLPFSDSFDPSPSVAWRKGFVATRSVSPGGNRPPASPDGGRMLEVVDSSGGGDVSYLAAAYPRLNLEAWLWIPADAAAGAGWSTGVGVATRTEAAWFSSSASFGIENGFYLEYENATLAASGGTLKAGAIPMAPRALRLLAVDGSASVAAGSVAAASATVLATATPASVAAGAWNRIRLAVDRPANRLIATVGQAAQPFYDGPIPAGGYDLSGGAVVGFRENHSGTPVAGEATYLDGLVITDQVVESSVLDYYLY